MHSSDARRLRVESRRAALTAALLALSLLFPGCASGPVATVRNGADVPLSVTFWTSERVGGFAQTWANMRGQADRVDPGKRKAFRLSAYSKAADPVLRMQVITRGPSWEPSYNYWFEIVTAPPLTITLEGSPDRLGARPNHGIVQSIPWARVPEERRKVDQPTPAPGQTPKTPAGSGSRRR